MIKLNKLQENYLSNVQLLQALNYPTDLFDNLYIENFKKSQTIKIK